HAFDDDGTGRVVGARFRAEPQEADAVRVDTVALDQAHDGRGRHRIDALGGPAQPEAMTHDGPRPVPRVVGPAAPLLEIDSVGRHVHGKAADSHLIRHRTPNTWQLTAAALGRPAVNPAAII